MWCWTRLMVLNWLICTKLIGFFSLFNCLFLFLFVFLFNKSMLNVKVSPQNHNSVTPVRWDMVKGNTKRGTCRKHGTCLCLRFCMKGWAWVCVTLNDACYTSSFSIGQEDICNAKIKLRQGKINLYIYIIS